jgi:hypothetical protein
MIRKNRRIKKFAIRVNIFRVPSTTLPQPSRDPPRPDHRIADHIVENDADNIRARPCAKILTCVEVSP